MNDWSYDSHNSVTHLSIRYSAYALGRYQTLILGIAASIRVKCDVVGLGPIATPTCRFNHS